MQSICVCTVYLLMYVYLAVLWGPFHLVTLAGYPGLPQVPRGKEVPIPSIVITTIRYCPLFYCQHFSVLPAGVTVALTWLGNLRGGLGPPGYRGDINGWKKTKQTYCPGSMCKVTNYGPFLFHKNTSCTMALWDFFLVHSPKQETNQKKNYNFWWVFFPFSL